MVAPFFRGGLAQAQASLARSTRFIQREAGREVRALVEAGQRVPRNLSQAAAGNVSRRELVRRTGIPITTMRNIELGLVTPRASTLASLERTLDSDRFRSANVRARTVYVDRVRFTEESLAEAPPPEAGDSFFLTSEAAASPGKQFGSVGPFDATVVNPAEAAQRIGLDASQISGVVWRKRA